MATTTFDKTIYLDQAAAERLADMLERPTPPLLKNHGEENFWEDNERKVKEWLSRCKK